jgi:hypothetical protein
MLRYIRRHHLALLALFIALGSGAYAASVAPKDSVVSSSIRNGEVNTADLADEAVTADKLARGAAAKAIDFDQASNPAAGAPATVLSLHELKLQADCYTRKINGEQVWEIDLSTTSAAAANYNGYSIRSNGNNDSVFTSPFGFSLAPGDSHQLDASYVPYSFVRNAFSFVYSTGARVITVDLNEVVNASTGRCQVSGTALPVRS